MAGAVVRGRPQKTVDEEELRYLRQTLGFTWKEIESLIGVSSKTLQRRAQDWDIHKYTHISEESLSEEVDDILARFPNSGEVMVNGHLKARNVWVNFCYRPSYNVRAGGSDFLLVRLQ